MAKFEGTKVEGNDLVVLNEGHETVLAIKVKVSANCQKLAKDTGLLF